MVLDNSGRHARRQANHERAPQSDEGTRETFHPLATAKVLAEEMRKEVKRQRGEAHTAMHHNKGWTTGGIQSAGKLATFKKYSPDTDAHQEDNYQGTPTKDAADNDTGLRHRAYCWNRF